MHFETMILLLFSVLGLIDGALFALLFRRRRFYFYALAMAFGVAPRPKPQVPAAMTAAS